MGNLSFTMPPMPDRNDIAKESENKTQSREAFRQFVEKVYGCQFGSLGDKGKLHEALTRFYIDEIYNKTHTVIDDEDFRIGYVNGAGELDVDLIHKSDENVLIV